MAFLAFRLHKNYTTRQTWQMLNLKAITKAKVVKFPLQSFTSENTLHSTFIKKRSESYYQYVFYCIITGPTQAISLL